MAFPLGEGQEGRKVRLLKFLIFLLLLFVLVVLVSPFVPSLKSPLAPFHQQLMGSVSLFEVSFPTWSKDGKSLLFVGGKTAAGKSSYDIYLVSLGTREMTRVTKQGWSHFVGFPFLSPDGRSFVFVAGEGGERGVYLADLQGYSVRKISKGGDAGLSYSPFVWSRDGKKVAFYTQDVTESKVWIYSMKEGEAIPLNLEGDFAFPSFAPVSVEIPGRETSTPGGSPASTRTPSATEGASAGGETPRPESPPAVERAPSPEPSAGPEKTAPGGSADREILLLLGKGRGESSSQIFAVKDDGTSLTPLTRDEMQGIRKGPPIWEPGGKKFLFFLMRGTQAEGIEVMDFSSGTSDVYRGLPPETQYPSWSADGRKMAFEGKDEKERWQIFTIQIGDKEVKKLQADGKARFPTWQINGRRLAFSAAGGFSGYRLAVSPYPVGEPEFLTPSFLP